MNTAHWKNAPVNFKINIERMKELGTIRDILITSKNRKWKDWLELAENYEKMGAVANAATARKRAAYFKSLE